MRIGGRMVGPGEPPYVIAEVSCNHGGKLSRAMEMIDAAKSCGADAVKFQCYTAETITLDCDRPEFIVQDGPWKGRRLFELYKKTETPFEWFPAIKARADKVGIAWMASVFDRASVDLMAMLDAPAIKIASFEIVDTPLIRYAANTGKPLIISTGMASLEEAKAAYTAAGPNHIFLRCSSAYPAPLEEVGLTQMYGVAGFSDHTMGIEMPIAATALGACIIEKHFRLSWHPDTEDSAFSLDEIDLYEMTKSIHNTWRAMQNSERTSETPQRQMRRSLFVVTDIKAGDIFTEGNVRSIRPGHGLSPSMLPKVIGERAARDIARGEPMDLTMLG